MLCNLARSIIGVRRILRIHFNVQTGCRENYQVCHKYMKRFGTLVLCYEFGWSLAGLQALRQMWRVYIPLLLLRISGKSVDGQGNKFHKISVLGEKLKGDCHV